MGKQKEIGVWVIASLLLCMGVCLSFGWGSTGWGYAGKFFYDSPVFWELRLPRTVLAILAGGGLALAGWLMQALFRNPLASPSILGVTNGASLGVAMATMLMAHQTTAMSSVSTVLAGAVGAFSVLLLLGILKKWIASMTGLLIFGVMLGHFTGALESIIQQWTQRENLSGLIYWSMGSFDHADLMSNIILMFVLLICVWIIFWQSKALDAWVMGDDFAQSLGISVSSFSYLLIVLSGLLTAVITAYCGPIAFIGLASPHLAKLWCRRRNHRALLWGVLFTGTIIGLYCDILTRVLHWPINAITSMIGAPWVMWWIIQKGRA